MSHNLSNLIKSHAASLDHSVGQIKFAMVASTNPNNATVRVVIQPEGVLSGWLPVVSQWIGSGWGMVCLPSPGDQVLVAPQEGDIEQGVVIGGIYSTKQNAPVAPAGEFWIVHASGSSLKLCNDGTVRVNGDLHVSGDIYDSTGSLSRLRTHYNNHTHAMRPNGSTTTPVPTD